MRGPDGSPPSSQYMDATLTRIREAAVRNGIAPGIHAMSMADAERRLAEGWKFVAVVSELKCMLDGVAQIAQTFHPELLSGELAKY